MVENAAVLWYNYKPSGQEDHRTMHAGTVYDYRLHVALAKQGDYRFGSICPLPLFRLNRLTYDLHLLHGGRP